MSAAESQAIVCLGEITGMARPILTENMKAVAQRSFAGGFRLGLGDSHRTIWGFSGRRDTSESVKTAIRSGLITDVMALVGCRDVVGSNSLGADAVQEVAEMVGNNPDVNLILCRFLWQTQPSDRMTGALSNIDYYVEEFDRLREEAVEIGADGVALDTESYGPVEVTEFLRKPSFTETELMDIQVIVDAVIRRCGRVDFTLPAGSARRNHPYFALARLGVNRICEGTYCDFFEELGSIGYPYEIVGMYTHIQKANDWPTPVPHKKFWLATEVFGRASYLWRSKKGLFIWPREDRALEVAQSLVTLSEG